MSFPSLEVFSDPSDSTNLTVISLIDGLFDDADDITLTCDKFSADREYAKLASGSGQKGKQLNIPYDHVRFRWTWIGHIDVNTDSCAYGKSINTDSSLDLLLQAAFHANNISHNVPKTLSEEAGLPNLNPGYRVAHDQSDIGWIHKYDENVAQYTDVWLIKNTSIAHNGNGTSRVSITLERFSEWEKITTLITDSNQDLGTLS